MFHQFLYFGSIKFVNVGGSVPQASWGVVNDRHWIPVAICFQEPEFISADVSYQPTREKNQDARDKFRVYETFGILNNPLRGNHFFLPS
jgi:hypothetical protein